MVCFYLIVIVMFCVLTDKVAFVFGLDNADFRPSEIKIQRDKATVWAYFKVGFDRV